MLLLLLQLLFQITPTKTTFAYVPIVPNLLRSQRVDSLLVAKYVVPLDTTSMTEISSLSFDNIRQYVPLCVSVLVILDILLGSPIANGVLNQIRSSSDNNDINTNENNANEGTKASLNNNNNNNNILQQPMTNSKERIDSVKVAQAAIQKAKYTLELRAYLDAQRDPVIELQRKMDQQSIQLEQNSNTLQNALQERKKREKIVQLNNPKD